MVRGVEVLAIPARREEDVGTDTSIALLVGEVDCVVATGTGRGAVGGVGEAGSLPATEGKGVSLGAGRVDGLPRTDHGVTSDHAEALTEDVR